MARKGKNQRSRLTRRFTQEQKNALSALKKYSDVKKTVTEARKTREEAEKSAVSAQKAYKTASYKLADEAAAILCNFNDLVIKSKHDLTMVVELIDHGFAGRIGVVGKPRGKFFSMVRCMLQSNGDRIELYSIP